MPHAWLLVFALLGAGCERRLPEPQAPTGLTIVAAERTAPAKVRAGK